MFVNPVGYAIPTFLTKFGGIAFFVHISNPQFQSAMNPSHVAIE
jgi:hypothetical protein